MSQLVFSREFFAASGCGQSDSLRSVREVMALSDEKVQADLTFLEIHSRNPFLLPPRSATIDPQRGMSCLLGDALPSDRAPQERESLGWTLVGIGMGT
jgi:hypothetical protein